MRTKGPHDRSRAVLLSVFALVALVLVGVAWLSLAATAREQGVYRDYADAVRLSCNEFSAYQMTLEVDPVPNRVPVDAAWARIDALAAPSPLATDVAQARSHLGDLVRTLDVSSPGEVGRAVKACSALVGASLSHAGPTPATMLPGPT